MSCLVSLRQMSEGCPGGVRPTRLDGVQQRLARRRPQAPGLDDALDHLVQVVQSCPSLLVAADVCAEHERIGGVADRRDLVSTQTLGPQMVEQAEHLRVGPGAFLGHVPWNASTGRRLWCQGDPGRIAFGSRSTRPVSYASTTACTRSRRPSFERTCATWVLIVFWVGSEADKQALVQDEASPFFTTTHFDGHPSVLLRASRIGELTLQELAETVQDAWLSRASRRRAAAWLSAHPLT